MCLENIGYVEDLLALESIINSYNKRGLTYKVNGTIGSLCDSYVLGIAQADPISFGIPSEMTLDVDGQKVPVCEIEAEDIGLFTIKANPNLNQYRQLPPTDRCFEDKKVWGFFSSGRYPEYIGLEPPRLAEILQAYAP